MELKTSIIYIPTLQHSSKLRTIISCFAEKLDLDVGDNHLYNKTTDKSATEYHTYEGQKTKH